MQVHIQNDGPVTIELESPAPGAASSDPKQVSLEPGACISLEDVSHAPWPNPRLWSSPHLEVEETLHGYSSTVILLYFLSPQEYMFTLSLLSRSQA